MGCEGALPRLLGLVGHAPSLAAGPGPDGIGDFLGHLRFNLRVDATALADLGIEREGARKIGRVRAGDLPEPLADPHVRSVARAEPACNCPYPRNEFGT